MYFSGHLACSLIWNSCLLVAWLILLIIFLHLFSWKSYYLDVGSSDLIIVSIKKCFHPFLSAHSEWYFKILSSWFSIEFFACAIMFSTFKTSFCFLIVFFYHVLLFFFDEGNVLPFPIGCLFLLVGVQFSVFQVRGCPPMSGCSLKFESQMA